ncbi:MAG: flagellin lysine-N-methylase [Acutalibacteraceae bacterium]|nr:flagellin lysine-N-methylase [Acutalibacteraceae bacterium]
MTLQPTYYRKFKCIADKCKDNCCIGWEIAIDEDSYNFYQSVNNDFAKKLQRGILKRENEYSFKLCENKRCAFLNENNLCDIICNLGENALCQICNEHPRYYNFYKDVEEKGLGLACEEACRIILTEEKPINFINTENNKACNIYTTDDIYLNFLIEVRDILIKTLHSKSYNIYTRVAVVIRLCNIVQNMANSSYTDIELYQSIDKLRSTALNLLDIYKEIKTDCNNPENSFNNIIKDFMSLEVLDTKWSDLLKNTLAKIPLISLKKSTKKFGNKYDIIAENISVYFVQRYFLEGYFNNQINEFGIFTAISLILITLLTGVNYSDLTQEIIIDTVHNFSKEIEYSDENIENLYNLFNKSAVYKIDNIINILLYFI